MWLEEQDMSNKFCFKLGENVILNLGNYTLSGLIYFKEGIISIKTDVSNFFLSKPTF